MTLQRLPSSSRVAVVTIPSRWRPLRPSVSFSQRNFLLDNSEVDGNANLFDGSRIRTDKASSKVYLMCGATLVLWVNSAGTIYKDHFTLLEAAAKEPILTDYAIVVDCYDIRPVGPGRKVLSDSNQGSLEFAALAGSLQILDQKGALLSRLSADTRSAFHSGLSTLPAGASTANVPNRTRRLALLSPVTGAALSCLGLATDAILQPSSTSSERVSLRRNFL